MHSRIWRLSSYFLVHSLSCVQTAEMDVFACTLDLIRAESDIIIQGSTGGASWGVTHDGMKDFQILTGALGLGALAIRVGFGDSFYYAPGKTATTNVELVTRARALVEAMGLEPMTAEEARRTLEISSKSLDS